MWELVHLNYSTVGMPLQRCVVLIDTETFGCVPGSVTQLSNMCPFCNRRSRDGRLGGQSIQLGEKTNSRPRKVNYMFLIPFLVIFLLNELHNHHTIIYNILYLLKRFHVL